jgi:hypothetical protein
VLGWVQNHQRLLTLHHPGIWAIVIFTIFHIYAAVRENIRSRHSMVSTMISGTRTFQACRADQGCLRQDRAGAAQASAHELSQGQDKTAPGT